MRRTGLVAAVAVVALSGATVSTALPASAVTPAPKTLRMGSVTLRSCDLGLDERAWCGSIKVPLDRSDPGAASITIGFGWRPAGHAATGTIVAQEGGPGYPSTGTAPDFADMLGSLLDSRNLLVVDARGTGRSTPVDCEPLQSLDPVTPTSDFENAVARCGAQLDHTFTSSRGGYVHASDLFGTAQAAADLAAVLHALGQGAVDLYGDSYGTYFAQSFLARYPKLLRSVVLDSAYEARDLDPTYVTTVQTARRSFDAVCRRAVACRRATAGSGTTPWQRIGTLAALLRTHAITGRAVGVDAQPVDVGIDVTALVNLVNDAGYDADVYRQLDAAVRAYLDHRDATPLLRLYAQDVGYDYSDYAARATYYSDGLYLAVACTDYPQLFDLRSSRAARRRQLDAAIAKLPASTFAPFTTREWLSVLPYTETYTGCLSWPKPTHPADPPVPAGASMDATDVPVLILNGALDSLTPAAGGAHIARQIGPAARAVVVPGTVHLVGLDDRYGCGSALVRRFLVHPARRLDIACTATVPEVHAVATFPRTVAAAPPAAGDASARRRRLATVALETAGDAATRYNYIDGTRDLGLRGGKVRYAGDDSGTVTAALSGVHWTDDSSVSGTVTADAAVLRVRGRLTVTDARGRRTTFTVSWHTTGRHTVAQISTGRTVLHAPAP